MNLNLCCLCSAVVLYKSGIVQSTSKIYHILLPVMEAPLLFWEQQSWSVDLHQKAVQPSPLICRDVRPSCRAKPESCSNHCSGCLGQNLGAGRGEVPHITQAYSWTNVGSLIYNLNAFGHAKVLARVGRELSQSALVEPLIFGIGSQFLLSNPQPQLKIRYPLGI